MGFFTYSKFEDESKGVKVDKADVRVYISKEPVKDRYPNGDLVYIKVDNYYVERVSTGSYWLTTRKTLAESFNLHKAISVRNEIEANIRAGMTYFVRPD